MKILVLNGSPRKNGNTANLLKAFAEGAAGKGHTVKVLPVGSMKINGCLACEYCHGRGNGQCCQQDDMQQIYPELASADLVVFAGPVHYWGLSGQLQSCITRFYAPGSPRAKRYALILSSGSPGVYRGIISQYNDVLEYWEAENLGIKTFSGENQLTPENLASLRDFGASL